MKCFGSTNQLCSTWEFLAFKEEIFGVPNLTSVTTFITLIDKIVKNIFFCYFLLRIKCFLIELAKKKIRWISKKWFISKMQWQAINFKRVCFETEAL